MIIVSVFLTILLYAESNHMGARRTRLDGADAEGLLKGVVGLTFPSIAVQADYL
jgi:hypothetical protein